MKNFTTIGNLRVDGVDSYAKSPNNDHLFDSCKYGLNLLEEFKMSNVFSTLKYDFTFGWKDDSILSAKNVQQVYVNKRKRTVTIIMKDGRKGTAKASTEDVFDVEVGIRLAFLNLLQESKTQLSKEIDKIVKRKVKHQK